MLLNWKALFIILDYIIKNYFKSWNDIKCMLVYVKQQESDVFHRLLMMITTRSTSLGLFYYLKIKNKIK